MAQLDYLVWHCSATLVESKVTVADIHKWHTLPRPAGRGWDRDGYSDAIYQDGTIHNLTPFNQDNKVDPWEMTWGARGVNARSRHVVYIGGVEYEVVEDAEGIVKTLVPADTRTREQLETMEIYTKYMIKRHPNLKVAGHNQFSNKACPSFGVPTWAALIGIPPKNIHYG